jgi:hypothetical protein
MKGRDPCVIGTSDFSWPNRPLSFMTQSRPISHLWMKRVAHKEESLKRRVIYYDFQEFTVSSKQTHNLITINDDFMTSLQSAGILFYLMTLYQLLFQD